MALILDNCEGILLSLDSHKSVPAPFLTKTYQLVDDPATDHIVSWGEDDTTFVVWRPPEFARDLLPNYFKHNNFSSFVRQLNTYGFRKIVPDRWEFANEFFKKGEKHLLCEIHRRKTAMNHHHHHSHALNHPIGCGGPGFFSYPTGRVSISPPDSSDDQVNWSCDSPPPLSSPLATAGAANITNYSNSNNNNFVTALSEDNERLRRNNNMLMSELTHMRKLYNDIIYFVQNHVKPVTPSTLINNNGSAAQKPLNQLIGYGHHHHHHYQGNPKQGCPYPQVNNMNSPSGSSVTILEEAPRTKLFGVPIQNKKRLRPDHHYNSSSMDQTINKTRLVIEKDDLGLNLMPPSSC